MQNEGKIDAVPGMDNNTESEATGFQSEPVAASEPVTPAPVAPVEEAPVTAGSGNDVQDYMAQLLNRMRGGEEQPAEEGNSSTPSKPAATTSVTMQVPSSPQAEQDDQPVDLLTAEEFVPKQKGRVPQSYDAMREIANSSARSAVRKSDQSQQKVGMMIKSGLAAAGGIGSLLYFCWGNSAYSLACFCVAFCAGYLFYTDHMPLNKKK